VGVALGMAMTVFGARPQIVSGWLASVAHGLVACPFAFARGRAAVTLRQLVFPAVRRRVRTKSCHRDDARLAPSQVGVVRFGEPITCGS
jgi:hypothetical protein